MQNLAKNKDTNKKDRLLYIIEAALEYFIALLLEGTYIAKIGTNLGMSDGLIGIVTSVANLGAVFGLLALFMSPNGPVKRKVLLFHTINQVFFSLTWLIPLFGLPKEIKIVAFIVFLLGGYIISNTIVSSKIDWYMGKVSDNKRGVFTATKERVSLISGLIFSFLMSFVVDHFEESGNIKMAFLIGGLTMIGITCLHSLTILFTKDRETSIETIEKKKENPIKIFYSLFKNKTYVRVLLLTILANITLNISTPFYGTYLVNDLGFTMVFITIIDIVYVVVRSLASILMGKYADRTSFLDMFRISFVFCLMALIIMAFATPESGKVIYLFYRGIFLGIFWAGYCSALINMIYDAVEREQRTHAYAVYSAISGLAGFLTALVISPIVSKAQEVGSTFFIGKLYIQQGLSIIATIFGLLVLLYSFFVVKKIKKEKI